MAGQIPEALERAEFYQRVLRSIAERVPGYEVETGEMFFGLVSAYEIITSHFGDGWAGTGLRWRASTC